MNPRLLIRPANFVWLLLAVPPLLLAGLLLVGNLQGDYWWDSRRIEAEPLFGLIQFLPVAAATLAFVVGVQRQRRTPWAVAWAAGLAIWLTGLYVVM